MGYCTVDDLRDEGITTSMLSDSRATALIERASRYIEKVTGQWFEPRSRHFIVNADGSRVVYLGAPIIQIDAIKLVSGRGDEYTEWEYDLEQILVFNRHLTQGLLNPDDRLCPRIEFQGPMGVYYPGWETIFPEGRQVVRIEGVFGYTDLPDGVDPGETFVGSQIPTSQGETPKDIEHVCKLLVVREMGLMSDPSRRDGWLSRWRIEAEKTMDQSYKMTPLDRLGMAGQFTGDPEIDGILAQYRSPIGVAAV